MVARELIKYKVSWPGMEGLRSAKKTLLYSSPNSSLPASITADCEPLVGNPAPTWWTPLPGSPAPDVMYRLPLKMCTPSKVSARQAGRRGSSETGHVNVGRSSPRDPKPAPVIAGNAPDSAADICRVKGSRGVNNSVCCNPPHYTERRAYGVAGVSAVARKHQKPAVRRARHVALREGTAVGGQGRGWATRRERDQLEGIAGAVVLVQEHRSGVGR